MTAIAKFGIGARVRAFGGNTSMLVVDLDIEQDRRTCAWRVPGADVKEAVFPLKYLVAA